MASDEVRKSMARLLLGHAQAEYGELADSWKSIEQKAQGTVAIVGIFMATTPVVYSKVGLVGVPARILLIHAVLFMVAAALVAISTLFVRSFTSIEGLEDVALGADDVYRAPDDGPDREAIREFVDQRIEGWKAANKALHEENHRKAKVLQWAQYLLFVGVILLTLVYGWLIIAA